MIELRFRDMKDSEVYARAKLALRQNDIKTAISFYDQLIEHRPTNPECYLRKCICLLSDTHKDNDLHVYETCLEHAKTAIKLDPQCPAAYIIYGQCLASLNRPTEALRSYKKALMYDPGNMKLKEQVRCLEDQSEEKEYESNIQIGELVKKVKKFGFGQDAALLESLPSPQDKTLKSEYLHLLNDDRLKPFIPLCPEVVDQTTSDTDYESEDNDLDIPSPRPIPKDLTEDETEAARIKQLGNEAYKDKDFEEALVFYTQATELDPTDVTFVANKAAVYLAKSEIDQARNCCHHALKIAHKHGCASKIVAKIYSRLGTCEKIEKNYHTALRYYKKSVSVEAPNKTMQQDMAHCKKRVKEEKRREYWDVEKFHTELKLGQWHFGNGKYQDAIDSFVEALKRLPDTMKESQKYMAKLHTQQAECHLRLVDYTSCLASCEAAIKVEKQQHRPWAIKGFCYEAQRMFDDGINSFTVAIRMDADQKDSQDGLKRCLKAAFALRNDAKQIKARTYNDEQVKTVLADTKIETLLTDIKTNENDDYIRDAELSSKLQKLIDVGLLRIDSDHAKIYPPYKLS